jgi:hypothetical protein
MCFGYVAAASSRQCWGSHLEGGLFLIQGTCSLQLGTLPGDVNRERHVDHVSKGTDLRD